MLSTFFGHSVAWAADHRAVAPAGGGLDAVEVAIDGEAGVLKVRRCKTADCSETGGTTKSIPIPIESHRGSTSPEPPSRSSRLVRESRSSTRGSRMGNARISRSRRSSPATPTSPIFAGLTGHTRGEEGDRSGQVVLVYDRDDHSKFVLVAEAREDTRICGQSTTPLGARGLDPKTMQLRGATLHRLEKKARDGAARIVAQSRTTTAKAPLARVLFATGGSAAGAQALTDGKPDTTWSERRPGDGHGEFATMRAPSEVPIHSFIVTFAPSSLRPDGAAPRTFFIATDQRLFHVTMPEDAWQKPGQSYDITLPAAGAHHLCRRRARRGVCTRAQRARGVVRRGRGGDEVRCRRGDDGRRRQVSSLDRALTRPRPSFGVAMTTDSRPSRSDGPPSTVARGRSPSTSRPAQARATERPWIC